MERTTADGRGKTHRLQVAVKRMNRCSDLADLSCDLLLVGRVVFGVGRRSRRGVGRLGSDARCRQRQ